MNKGDISPKQLSYLINLCFGAVKGAGQPKVRRRKLKMRDQPLMLEKYPVH